MEEKSWVERYAIPFFTGWGIYECVLLVLKWMTRDGGPALTDVAFYIKKYPASPDELFVIDTRTDDPVASGVLVDGRWYVTFDFGEDLPAGEFSVESEHEVIPVLISGLHS